jgi:pimeloyl-ACP methyl ester carboxylesterase
VGAGKPGTTTQTPAGPRPLPPLETPRGASISWRDCNTETRNQLGTPAPPPELRYECARVTVQLDSPTLPRRATLRIALTRVGQGTTPLLVVNDADGEPGTLYAARLAATLPPAWLKTFSLIGIDRRGTGGSEGAECLSAQQRRDILGYEPTQTDLTGLLDTARNAGQECVFALEEKLAAYDSYRAAADLDTIRNLLGVTYLNALGHGEGSQVLTTFASRYPDHIGRIVLDGAPDPILDGTGRAESRAAAAETAFTTFAADCVRRACRLGANPRQTVTQLLDQLRSGAITAADRTRLDAGTALYAIRTGLAEPARWPQLADAIADARDGRADALAAVVRPWLARTGTLPPRLDGGLITRCNDDGTRLPPERVSGTARDWLAKYPLFGGQLAQDLLLCGPFPVPQRSLPRPTVTTAPPILVLGSGTDPVTPSSGTEHAAQQLSTAVTLTWQGTGHGAVPSSACSTTATTGFLIDARPPTTGTVCPP